MREPMISSLQGSLTKKKQWGRETSPPNPTKMKATITFKSAESLAEFISQMIPKSTANFQVFEEQNGTYTLTYDGGY